MTLSQFELIAIKFILEAYEFVPTSQISELKALDRFFSGVGVTTDFVLNEPPVTKVLGGDVIGERDDFPDVLRFQLSVSSGQICSLEIFSNYGDWFPSEFEGVKLSIMG